LDPLNYAKSILEPEDSHGLLVPPYFVSYFLPVFLKKLLSHKIPWPIDTSKPFNIIKSFGRPGLMKVGGEENGISIHAPAGTVIKAVQGGKILIENVLNRQHVWKSADVYIQSAEGIIWRYRNVAIDSIPEKFKNNIRPGRYTMIDAQGGGYLFEKEAPIGKIEVGEKIGEIMKWDNPNLPKTENGQDDHVFIEALYKPESEWRSKRDFMVELDSYSHSFEFLDPVFLFELLAPIKSPWTKQYRQIELASGETIFWNSDDEKAFEKISIKASSSVGAPENVLEVPDISASNTGGIDFNSQSMNLETRGQAIDFVLPVGVTAEGLMDAQGFVPTIINMAPVTDFMGLLGLTKEDGELKIEDRS
jgi:hypothetical protein